MGYSISHILRPVMMASLAVLLAGCPMSKNDSYPVTPPVVSRSPQAGTPPVSNPLTGSTGTAEPTQVTPTPMAPTPTTPAPPVAGGPPPVTSVAGGQVLSSGPYPPPAFPAPSQPGRLIVVDEAYPTTPIASTVVTGADSGKMMSITDVPNIAADLDKTHKYSVIFVPMKTGNP